MASGSGLPTRDDLVALDAELRDILLRIRQRQANGKATSGRYPKDDTARARYIKSVAQVGLRFGRVPSAHDLQMLRCATLASNALSRPEKEALEQWSDTHARDPRKQRVEWSDEAQQTTLLRWLERETTNMSAPINALRGKRKAYTLDFGDYNGYTLSHMIRKGAINQPVDLKEGDQPKAVPPGAYLLWLCNVHDFQFPKHIAMYFALRDAAEGGASVYGNDGMVTLELPASVHAQYEAHAASVLEPREGDVDPGASATASTSPAASVRRATRSSPPPPPPHRTSSRTTTTTTSLTPRTPALQARERSAEENASADYICEGIRPIDRRFFDETLEEIGAGDEYSSWRVSRRHAALADASPRRAAPPPPPARAAPTDARHRTAARHPAERPPVRRRRACGGCRTTARSDASGTPRALARTRSSGGRRRGGGRNSA